MNTGKTESVKDAVWSSTGYVPVRAHRCRVIISALERHCRLEGASALDIGCGSGILARALAERGAAVTGLDPDEASCAAAEKLCGGKARFLRLTAERAGEVPGDFDIVIMSEVLEHLEDDLGALKVAAEKIRPGGLFLATVPIWPAYWSGVDEADGHYRRYEPEALPAAAAEAGLKVLGTRRFHWLYYRAQQAYLRLSGKSFYSEGVFGDGRLPSLHVRLGAAAVFALDGLFSALGLGAHMLVLARKPGPQG